MKDLVTKLYRGDLLDPDQSAELERLHKKQSIGVGGLTPNQLEMLDKLKE